MLLNRLLIPNIVVCLRASCSFSSRLASLLSGTAVQGVAAAELSYQGALWYAKERLAMRSLTGPKNTEGHADPIICHPDVRKMLLTQRCIAEAGRSMVYECALLNDLMMEADATGDEKEVKRIEGELHFLTPILKGFLTEMGVEAANLGIQILILRSCSASSRARIAPEATTRIS